MAGRDAGTWLKTTLGELVAFQSGGTPSKGNDRFWNGTIPWVSAKDMKRLFLEDSEDHITEGAIEDGYKIVPKNTVLMLIRGMTLLNDVPICILRRPASFNQDVKALRPREPLVGEFLPYLLLGNKQRLLGIVDLAGHGTGRLNTDELKSLDLLLPSPKEQRAIAAVLGSIDDKIELNRRVNESLEGIARALFKSWFVDFDPVRAKIDGRALSGMDPATAALFPDHFEHTEWGLIPRGWSVGAIRDLASNIQYGLTQSASEAPVGPRFLRITDIQGGRVDWGSVPYCEVTPDEYDRYLLQPRDILVARTGASTGENIYLPVVPDAVFASYLVRFQFSDEAMSRLVGAFMRTPVYFDYVAGSIGGSAQPNASAQVLAGASLVIPPIPVLKRFAATLAPLDRLVAANQEQSRTLAALRDALLPKLLSGEIRVRAAEKLVEDVA